MGDNPAEERKEAAMKTKNEETKIMDASVIITVRINGISGYSEIVLPPVHRKQKEQVRLVPQSR